nr:hypothetical protein [Oscillospiraceae bacterium]
TLPLPISSMFSTSAFFQTLLCFLLFYRFFPLWQDKISGRGHLSGRFLFFVFRMLLPVIFLGIFPGICYDGCRAFCPSVCDTGVTDAVLQSACESKKRVRIKI